MRARSASRRIPADRAAVWRGRKAAFAAVGPDQPGLLRAGRRGAAHHAARGAAPDRRALAGARPARRKRLSRPATAICIRSCSTDGRVEERPRVRRSSRTRSSSRASTPAARSPANTASATTRRARCPLYFGEDDIATMQRLRRAFDPRSPCESGEALPDPAALRRGARGRIARIRSRRPGLQTGSEIVEYEPGDLTCIVEGGHPAVCAALGACRARAAALARPARRPDARGMPRRRSLRPTASPLRDDAGPS